MAIFERGYRDLAYRPTAPFRRIWPIARHELAAIFRIRFGTVIFIVCLAPTIGSLIFLLASAGIWETEPRMRERMAGFDPSLPSFFLRPITSALGFLPFLVLTTLVSARAIAKDRAAGALEIYWTRAITPLGYFVGKVLGSFLLLATVFVVAPFVLWLTSVLIAPDWGQFEATIGFLPGMLLGLTVHAAAMAALAVGVSALASTPNMASIAWLFVVVGTGFVGQVLRRMLAEPWVALISPWSAAARVVDWFAGWTPVVSYPPAAAGVALAAALAAVLGLAARRLRVLEAVAT
ncbi:MAG TPA: hypothetical protein VK081_10565 [Planctomycetota bacterium]|nr:hypothetical protein [Planctomycetota bacterium]